MFRLLSLVLGIVALPALGENDHANHKLGTVVFPVSCDAQAQVHFNTATAWLHSFEYEEAEREYLAAANADNDCAMAHWVWR